MLNEEKLLWWVIAMREFSEVAEKLRPKIRELVTDVKEEALYLQFAQRVFLYAKKYRGKDLELMIRYTKTKFTVFYGAKPELLDKVAEMVLNYMR